RLKPIRNDRRKRDEPRLYRYSLNLDYALRDGGFDFLYTRCHLAREGVERLWVGRFFTCQHDRFAGVTGFVDVWIKFNISQEGNAKLLSGCLSVAFGEDVNVVMRLVADIVANVL